MKIVKYIINSKYSETGQGLQVLTDVFRLCKPLTDAQVLKNWLSDLYGSAAMADYPYPADFLSRLPAWPVRVMCTTITKSLGNPADAAPIDVLRAVYSGINVYLNFTGSTPCCDIDSDINSNTVNMVSWNYQTCTEFVFPMCSTGKKDMFEPQKWDFSTYSVTCYDQFKTLPRSEWPAVNYGVDVADIKSYSNIIFSNGGSLCFIII